MSNYQYTTIKMQQLRQMSKTPSIFDVLECTDLGVNAIYFERLEQLSVLEDYLDTFKYKLTAKSIEPAEFTIND